MKRVILSSILVFCTAVVSAQIIHSHNDYQQQRPFWTAYDNDIKSLEADIFLRNGNIVVCHDAKDVEQAPTFEQLYITPMVELQKNGKSLPKTMLIDFKASPSVIMSPFLKLLEKYPTIFNAHCVTVIISGSRPPVETYNQYPDFMTFDGQFSGQYTDQQLKKIAMISGCPNEFTQWDGNGLMSSTDIKKFGNAIEKAHKMGKPVRFWGAPDNQAMWLMMYHMGVDYINTDKLAECRNYFSSLSRNSFTLNNKQATYQPTFKSDGAKGKPKNVILIIGDGMSLPQITSAETANRGDLTLLKLRNIGLQKSYSLNSYNTDSAAAGTALATGKKTDNRHISMLVDGTIIPNSSEIISDLGTGMRIGVISSGDITDATPATYYAHSMDRKNSDEIASWLTKGKLSLLAGGNSKPFINRADNRNLYKELSNMGYGITEDYDSITLTKRDKVICIDQRLECYANDNNIDYLGGVTNDAIKLLANPNGFFLMVESARIDLAAHDNDLPRLIRETLCLDAVVAEALKFADSNGETLVVVTADHETGGLVLINGNRDNGSVNANFMLRDHSGLLIPVFAYGVGADMFRGVYENTEVMNKIIALLSSQTKKR